MQKVIEHWIARIRKMNEAEVLRSLRGLKSARNVTDDALMFINSVAIQPSSDLEPGIQKLHELLNAPLRQDAGAYDLYDYIECELNKRLEQLRRNDK